VWVSRRLETRNPGEIASLLEGHRGADAPQWEVGSIAP